MTRFASSAAPTPPHFRSCWVTTFPKAFLFAAILFLQTLSPALAIDQIVTDPGDNGGPNQLRAKIAALQSSGGGTLKFNIGTASIPFGSGFTPSISISTNTITDGGGRVTISGNDARQILGVSASGMLSLRNIAQGFQWSSFDGGAIGNFGSLNVDNCHFPNNGASARSC